MDILEIVNYEKLFDLVIRHPVTDEPVGLNMKIRSSGSAACKAIYRKHADQNLERRQKGKVLRGSQAEHEELERTAATIASWEWVGDLNFRGKKPELTMSNAIEVLEALGWVYGQVKEAASELENFSESSGPNSETN